MVGIDHIHDTTSVENATAYVIHKLTRLLRFHFNKVVQTERMNISFEQYFTLFRLHEKDGQFQTELTDKILKDRPNITRILDGLEKEGLVIRIPDSHDRRKFRIYLTEAGKSFITNLLPKMVDERKRVYEGVSHEEIAQLKQILKKIENNIIKYSGSSSQ